MIFSSRVAGFLFFIAQITTVSAFVREGRLKIDGYVSTCCFKLFTSETSLVCAVLLFSVPYFISSLRLIF